MKQFSAFLFMLGLVLATGTAFAADTYKIDPVHSSIGFSVQHLMVSQVTGQFDSYDGTIVYNKDAIADTKVNATIQVASINTRNDKRDEHLRNSDFFDVAKFPTISFFSKQVTPNLITGSLTLKGVTKEVSLPATILGPTKSLDGSTVIGISASLKINRQHFNMTWNKALDQGGVAIGDDVTITINIEAKREEPAKGL
jgi:polyisoprenoid-binding protein YceI